MGTPHREHAVAIDTYLTEHRLPAWEPKSYDKAVKAVPAPASAVTASQPNQPAASTAAPKDVFVWFDEPAPPPGAPLFEVVVTARAYDGTLAILRQVREGNIVQSGASVLDADYHPSTVSLSSWQKSNSGAAPALFFWQGEDVSGTTAVMHFEMTKRAYEQMLALVAGSDLRVRPSQSTNPE